jgi:tetratricopeptide (TPR) repeat protein
MDILVDLFPAAIDSMATAKNSNESKNAGRIDLKEQARLFADAMTRFQKRDYAGAREVFAKSGTGPDAAQAHSALMHVNMCDRRLMKAEAPKTADEHYMLGVASMNAGALEAAEENLGRALKSNDTADHYHYAMALCKGLKGDLAGCVQHLDRAIQIEPANRITARNDPDFQTLARQSPIKELLHAEKAG